MTEETNKSEDKPWLYGLVVWCVLCVLAFGISIAFRFLLAAGSPHSLWRMVSAVLLLFVLTAIFPTFVFRICTNFVQDRDRRILPFVRSVRFFCLTVAIWIGYENHWVGLAWIPIGALLILAIVGNLAAWICAFQIYLSVIFWRLRGVYEVHRTARVFRRSSAAVRGRMLAQVSPKLREHILNWMKNHGAS